MSPSRDGWRRALARPPTEWAWHGRVWVIDALHHVKIFHFFLMSVEETMTRIYHNTIFLSTSLSLSFELEHTETRTHISRAPFSNVCLISFFFHLLSSSLFSLFFTEKNLENSESLVSSFLGWKWASLNKHETMMRWYSWKSSPSQASSSSSTLGEHPNIIEENFFVNFYHPLLLFMFSCEMLWKNELLPFGSNFRLKSNLNF